MGIIDSTTNYFKCRNCGAHDSSRVIDRGSSYGGSNWGSPSQCEGFSIEWENSQFGEPTPARYWCRNCRSTDIELTSTT